MSPEGKLKLLSVLTLMLGFFLTLGVCVAVVISMSGIILEKDTVPLVGYVGLYFYYLMLAVGQFLPLKVAAAVAGIVVMWIAVGMFSGVIFFVMYLQSHKTAKIRK